MITNIIKNIKQSNSTSLFGKKSLSKFQYIFKLNRKDFDKYDFETIETELENTFGDDDGTILNTKPEDRKLPKYFQKYYDKYGDVSTNFVDEDRTRKLYRINDSNLFKQNIQKDPGMYRIAHPESKEEAESKFKKNPKISLEFTYNPENLDDYFIVGAEVFRNLMKDQALAGQPMTDNPSETNLYKGFKEAVAIKELRDPETLKEIYKPAKGEYNLAIYDSIVNNYSTWDAPLAYFNIPQDRRMEPMFKPSKKERPGYYDALPTFKSEFRENDRNIHNQKQFEIFSRISSTFNSKFTLEPEVEKIVKRLIEIRDENKEKYKYPDNPIFAYSTEAFSRCFKEQYFEDVTDFFTHENLLEVNELVKSLSQKIESMNHSLYGDLLMRLFLDLNFNVKSIWVQLEGLILNSLHHLQLKDICKIMYTACISSPRFTTHNFRKQLENEVLRNLSSYTPNEIIDVLIGFKYSRNADFYFELAEFVAKNHRKWIEKVNKNGEINNTKEKLMSSIFYSVAFSKPGKYKDKESRDRVNDFHDVFDELIDATVECIPSMEVNELILVLQGASISQTDEAAHLIVRTVERNLTQKLIKNKEKLLNKSQIAEIAKCLNQMRQGKMAGSDEFIMRLLQIALKQDIKQYTNEEFCEILYLYSSRRLETDYYGKVDEERKKMTSPIIDILNKRLIEIAPTILSYRQLSLIFWHLMAVQSRDTALIDTLLASCDKIEGRLSVKYYTSFKYFDYYLRNTESLKDKYNFETLESFRDRFFYAEQVYNVYKEEIFFDKDVRNSQIYYTLKQRLGYYPLKAVPYENMFLQSFTLETRKVSILILYERDYLPYSKKLTIKGLMKQQFLNTKPDWTTITMTWDEYLDLGNTHAREKFLFEKIEELSEEAVKKGLLVRNPRHL